MSRLRSLNTLLLIAAVIGGLLTYRASQTHRRLLAEQNRLEQKVGALPIEDPTKMHVRAFDTGEPLHFAWRVYIPAGFAPKWRLGQRGTTYVISIQPREFVARVRLHENEAGDLCVFLKTDSGGGLHTLGGPELAGLLRGRSDEIQVKQLGSDQLAVIKPGEPATLLRLTFSNQLRRDLEENLPKKLRQKFQKELLEYGFEWDDNSRI